jgi:hypothetical protein
LSTTIFVAPSISANTYSGSLVRGQTYIINSLGPAENQTDFTEVGAPNNNIGTKFTVPQSDPPGQPTWPEGVEPGLGNALNVNTIEVYVGGVRQYSVDSGIESTYPWTLIGTIPLTIDFDNLVPPNVEITILARQSQTWYQPGPDTASNGHPLQETNTLAARFLRGL